jgi:hypothetical protein
VKLVTRGRRGRRGRRRRRRRRRGKKGKEKEFPRTKCDWDSIRRSKVWECDDSLLD